MRQFSNPRTFFTRFACLLFVLAGFSGRTQAQNLELFYLDSLGPRMTGAATGFGGQVQEFSGTEAHTYSFLHSTDSLYLARFSPETASQDEPLVVYLRCHFPGAVFSNSVQAYDGFSPTFANVGGVNFVAYLKPNYAEYRFWNGTAWSDANTQIRPYFRTSPSQGKRMEVAIGWEAMMPGGGIPDSVQIAIYRINGNAGDVFSYAQMPLTNPAGGAASPSVQTLLTRRIKNLLSLQNPLHFPKTGVGQFAEKEFVVYNKGSQAFQFTNGFFFSDLPPGITTPFSVLKNASGTLNPRLYQRVKLGFQPIQMGVFSDRIRLSSLEPSFSFHVVGSAVGEVLFTIQEEGNSFFLTDAVQFGEDLPENTPVSRKIVVNSTGGDTLQIAPAISLNPTRFQIESLSKTSIPPGDSASFVVRFTGGPVGNYTGRFNLNPNLGEGSSAVRYDLLATVTGGTPEPSELRVYHIPTRLKKIDGIAGADWSGIPVQNSGTQGLDWLVDWSADTLYLARRGGNNSEPAILGLKAIFPGSAQSNLSPTYDGITSNFTNQGGLNFVFYGKGDYQEIRAYDGSAWVQSTTGFRTRFSTVVATANMEVAIPWSAITRNQGIPDSIRYVAYQTNGNPNSAFVYGLLPNNLAGGSITLVQANSLISKSILVPLDQSNPFSFGSVPVGTSADTNLIVYNRGPGTAQGIGNLLNSSSEFSAQSNHPETLAARSFFRSRVRFAPESQGPASSTASISYQSGQNNQTLDFGLEGNGIGQIQAALSLRYGSRLVLSGDTVHIPITTIGESRDTAVWVRNTGTDSLKIGPFQVTGAGYALFLSGNRKLAIGDSLRIPIRFAPNGAPGLYPGQLSFASNVSGLPLVELNLRAQGQSPNQAQSRLEILQFPISVINTSGEIPPSQLQPKLLLSNANGIRWYAAWDTTNLYVVKYGGNRAQPQLIFAKAHFPGATFTNSSIAYDGFNPDFSGIGGINFVAYLKETAVPYDEYRIWNGTQWTAANPGLLPQYGNQAGVDQFAVRIPWEDLTGNKGIPDSVNLVLYQTNGNAGGLQTYGQSPVSLPAGANANPQISVAHTRKIFTRLAPGSVFSFGTVPVGKAADTLFLFRNAGDPGSTLNLNGPFTLSGTSYSALLQTGSVSLAAGKWAAGRVRFQPPNTLAYAGSMKANGTFANPPGDYTVFFTGTGGTPAAPAVQVRLAGKTVGQNILLGDAEVGFDKDTTLYLVNTGTDTLRITGAGSVTQGWTLNRPPSPKIAPGDSSGFQIRRIQVQPGFQFGGFSMTTNLPSGSTLGFNFTLKGDSALAWFPFQGTINDSLTLIYQPRFGNRQLKDSNRIFIHTGIVTSGPTGTNWENVQGTFTVAADSVRLQQVDSVRFRIKFRIRDYYNITGNPQVYRLGMVFRNGNGSRVGKTRNDADFYIPINPNLAAASLQIRTGSGRVLSPGQILDYGLHELGGPAVDSLVILRNTGLSVLRFSLVNVASFSFSPVGEIADSLQPGQEDTLTIRLTPNGQGPLEGFFTAFSNASNAQTFQILLRATGIVANATRFDESRPVLFPNPGRESLGLTSPAGTEGVEYRIRDGLGRELQGGTWPESGVLDTRTLPKGLYWVEIQLPTGKRHVQKWVRE